MIQSSNNIWNQFIPAKNPLFQGVFQKKLSKIKVYIQDSPNSYPTYSTTSLLKLKRKRGRRNLKTGEDYDLALHTKDNDDNIKRKVKTHFHNFIVAYLNLLIKNSLKTKRQYRFRKMSSNITQDITIKYNKKLMDTPIKDILVQVSHKFKNKDINLYYIEKISQIKGDVAFNNENINTLNNILNMPYKDMMNNFYLKSTKKLFENEKIDESYEKHIENLMNKYGYNYMMKFKKNAENFVNFYLNSKQRNHKNSMEFGALSQINKETQNSINNLKLSLNNFSSKSEKKVFEITRENSTGESTKSNTLLTQSQSGSFEDSSEREENEKIDKDNKSVLNTKKSCLFNVFYSDN